MQDSVHSLSPTVEASDLERLRINDLLVGLDDKAFAKLSETCEFLTFTKGQELVEEGTFQNCIYLMVKGQVRIVQGDASDVDLVYREVGEDGWFGEIAALDKGERTASVFALSDGVVAVLPRVIFINLILEHRQIAVKILESLAAVIRSSNQRFSEVSSFSGIQRVYLLLIDMAEPTGDDTSEWVIDQMPTHEQLASKAMTSKDVVAKALSQILQMELAKRRTGKFYILNRERLKQLATEI
ncbi:MAG: Crp/Fnr family transcriptional regulator [Magnetovibrio sp.]|nr:Crp/Fnr family transcriptional regulator [Magnetovibrio sp.]